MTEHESMFTFDVKIFFKNSFKSRAILYALDCETFKRRISRVDAGLEKWAFSQTNRMYRLV